MFVYLMIVDENDATRMVTHKLQLFYLYASYVPTSEVCTPSDSEDHLFFLFSFHASCGLNSLSVLSDMIARDTEAINVAYFFDSVFFFFCFWSSIETK